MSYVLTPQRTSDTVPLTTLTEFYREEILKHQHCLRSQRECFSECTLLKCEAALTRLISELEKLCLQQKADEVVGSLLKELDAVTRLSAWSQSQSYH